MKTQRHCFLERRILVIIQFIFWRVHLGHNNNDPDLDFGPFIPITMAL